MNDMYAVSNMGVRGDVVVLPDPNESSCNSDPAGLMHDPFIAIPTLCALLACMPLHGRVHHGACLAQAQQSEPAQVSGVTTKALNKL